MSNIPRASSHHVLVEGFDYDSDVDGEFRSPAERFVGSTESEPNRITQACASSYGMWLEIVSIGLFAFAAFGMTGNVTNLLDDASVLIALAFVIVGLLVSFVVADRAGNPSRNRVMVAIGLAIVSFACSVRSLSQNDPTSNIFPTAIATGSSIGFWCLLRLTGETTLRCLFFGATIAVTLLIGLEPTATPFRDLVDKLTNWFTVAFFDMSSIPFRVEDSDFKFVSGSISSSLSADNYAGVVGVVGLVLGLSAIVRQSLILSFVSVVGAICWWSIFRAIVSLSAVYFNDLNGVWDSVAMPLYAWIALLACAVITQTFLNSFFATLPLDEHDIDHASLGQLYNLMVSFPQSGPKSVALFSLITKPTVAFWNSQNGDRILPKASFDQHKSEASIETVHVVGHDVSEWEPSVSGSNDLVRKTLINNRLDRNTSLDRNNE